LVKLIAKGNDPRDDSRMKYMGKASNI